MHFNNINLLAVLVAAIANMVIGFLWYSPMLFAKPWMVAIGKTEEDLKKGASGIIYFVTFTGALLMAFLLAHFIVNLVSVKPGDMVGALKIAIYAWLGFALPSSLGDVLFPGRSRKLLFINNGYWLLAVFVMAIILQLWR
jgi:hypothetical protein